jgi:thiosulfate/3-mercaptopyruvate sulfurtransferase
MGFEPLVSADWLATRIAQASSPTSERQERPMRIVHVSTDRQVYDERHIDGAIFSDLHVDLAKAGRPAATGEVQRLYILPTRDEVERTLAAWGVGADTDVVFYDDIGQNRYAARGYWLLRAYGFPADRLHLLDGGLGAWEADERPTTPDEPSIERAETAPKLTDIDPGLFATTDDVRRWSAESSQPIEPAQPAEVAGVSNLQRDERPTRLLDVRLIDEYLGTDVRARRAGHVPGARQRVFTDFLAPDGKLRTAPQIRAVLEGSGVRPEELRATYCQGGVRAALVWFALHEVAGLTEVRTYAASWEEWGNLPDTPIDR